MDVSEYRRRYEAELEGITFPAENEVPVERLRDRDLEQSEWLAALEAVSRAVDDNPDLIDILCELLRDETLPGPMRLAVIDALQEIDFRMAAFPAKRPVYLETLRSIVDDSDATLRRRAIAILARAKDSEVQRRLIDGLEHRAKALVPPAKAVQLLGYDLHAEHFPILRRIVERPPNPAARREALRLLAADPAAGDLLAGVLDDKAEPIATRTVSAHALQAAAPGRFEQKARRIVLDDDEDDNMRAMSISALAHFADPSTDGPENELLGRRIQELRDTSGSAQVKKAATDYLSRHGGQRPR